MKVIYNTFEFTPIFREGSGIEVKEAEIKGKIIVEMDEDLIVGGGEIVDQIENNPNKVYLVSGLAFNYLKDKGVGNICMFDPQAKDNKSTYGAIITP